MTFLMFLASIVWNLLLSRGCVVVECGAFPALVLVLLQGRCLTFLMRIMFSTSPSGERKKAKMSLMPCNCEMCT